MQHPETWMLQRLKLLNDYQVGEESAVYDKLALNPELQGRQYKFDWAVKRVTASL